MIYFPKFYPIIVRIVPPLIDPDLGDTEVTDAFAAKVRPSVPTSPRVLCLIETEKVSLSAPPNMHWIVFAESSTETTFILLTIVLFFVLVRLTEKSFLSRVAGKGCSRAIVTKVLRTGEAEVGEI